MMDNTLSIEQAEELYGLGNSYYPNNPYCIEYLEALDILNRLAILTPDNKNIFNFRWHIKYLQKNYEGALDDLNMAIQLDPKYSAALYNRGFLLRRMNREKEAKKDFYQAYEIAKKIDDEDLMDALSHYIDCELGEM